MEKIRTGIGEQVSHFMCLMAGFVICVAISFSYGWKLTLVVIGYVPIIIVTNIIIYKVNAAENEYNHEEFYKIIKIILRFKYASLLKSLQHSP